MTKKYHKPKDEKFTRKGRKVEIRAEGEQVEIVIDGVRHPVQFLDNGRPYTKAYVNVMADSVRDLAEKFVDQTAAEEAHWAKEEDDRSNDDAC